MSLSNSMWCDFKIGNKKFSSTVDTLKNIPYFRALVQFPSFSPDDPLRIDSDPTVFKHVLRWAQNPEYVIPSKYHWGLDFWGVSVTQDATDFDLRPCRTTIDKIDNELLSFNYWIGFDGEVSDTEKIVISVKPLKFYYIQHPTFLIPSELGKNLKHLEFDLLIDDKTALFGCFETHWEVVQNNNVLCIRLKTTLSKILSDLVSNKSKKIDIVIKLKSRVNQKIPFKGKLFYDYLLINDTYNQESQKNELEVVTVECVDGHLDTYYERKFSKRLDHKRKRFVIMTTEPVEEISLKKYKYSGVITEMSFDFRTKVSETFDQYDFNFIEIDSYCRYIFDVYPRPKNCWLYYFISE